MKWWGLNGLNDFGVTVLIICKFINKCGGTLRSSSRRKEVIELIASDQFNAINDFHIREDINEREMSCGYSVFVMKTSTLTVGLFQCLQLNVKLILILCTSKHFLNH